MKAHDRPARFRRDFLLEPLEGRALLSALPAAPYPTAEVAHGHHRAHHPSTVHTVTARVNGQISQPGALPGQDVLAVGIGQGTGHRFGQVTFVTEFFVHREDQYTGAATITEGAGSLTSPRLGQVDVVFRGSESIRSLTGGVINLTGTATGVSGKFAGFTGTFSARGNLNTTNGGFSMYITLKLVPPRPTPVVINA